MTNYEISAKGTSFHCETPNAVREILDANRRDNRLRFFYGKDGKIWNEEYDVIGYVGRSSGRCKVPLVIANSRSYGGGALLDHCVVRIQDVQTKRVLYQADGYTLPTFEIRPADSDLQEKGYSASVFDAEGSNCANFKTHKQASNWIAFMRGERMAK